MIECWVQVLIWVIAAIILTAIVCYLLFGWYVNTLKQKFISMVIQPSNRTCADAPPIVYTQPVYVPTTNGTYEKPLATALLDISLNTTKANCDNVLPLPNPPGFTHQLRIEGINPIDGSMTMYAYIFWNPTTGFACIAFTGTATKSEWKSDFQYQLVAPTALHGYTQDVLVHTGFYNIYLAIRDTLWAWWDQNQILIQNLFITGHSLGGALSTICAYDFAQAVVPSALIHYSFAAPRSGNVAYAQNLIERVPGSLRINNTEDIVPQLPPATFDGYTYQQTLGNVPFTVSLGNLSKDHIEAYMDYMPVCAEVAPCQRDTPSA
jgi:triacylglycerol lipase